MNTGFEVRSFLPIDLPLVHRLTPFGMSFDSLTALTRGVHTLEGAVFGAVPLADIGTPTFVLRDNDSGYVAQFRHKQGEQHAQIVFIAPSLDQCDDAQPWYYLLDAMLAAAGRRGAHTLNAEVAETGDAFVILRQAGFATYARQELWKRAPAPLPEESLTLQGVARLRLRPSTEQDAFALNSLHLLAVPRMVRIADTPPDPKHGFVLEYKDRLAAYLTIQEGKFGIYVQGIVQPDLSQNHTAELLRGVLALLPRADKLPVYFCVRRYQEWLQTPLESFGFAPFASQAVMVRHTTRRIQQAVLKPLQMREGGSLALPRIKESRDLRPASPVLSYQGGGQKRNVDGISHHRRSGETQSRSADLSG